MVRLVLYRTLLTKALAVVLVASLWASLCRPASALTPESPQVRAIADKAVKYLEGLTQPHGELGGVCLRGLAVYKYYHRYNKGQSANNIPEVKMAIDKIREELAQGLGKKESLNYSLGIAIIFLCEIDGDQKQYRTETEALLKALYDAQRPDGAWSYHNYKTGDTSQTQYGVLGTWYAMKKGYQVPSESLQKSVDWLLRTQDPSGAVPYQGTDPGSYNRVKQGDLRLSMSPAQLGCLYIAEDLAGLSGTGPQASSQEKSVFRSADASKRPRSASKVSVNVGMLRRAISDGNRYYSSNFKINIEKNLHYYLYSLERYHAMKAYSEGRRDGPAPWYDAGVAHLGKTQTKSGGWKGTRGLEISTSFALLFLVRSMEIAIEETAGGQSRGGYGLPPDLTRIGLDDLQDGQVVTPQKATDFTTIFETLEGANMEDYAVIMPTITGNVLDPDRGKRKEQVDKLRQLLTDGKFQNRLVAAKMLAGSGDVENVPHLIFALTDGDHRITIVARDGLRLISRKFSGFGLGDKPTEEEKEFAAQKWNKWYRSVRPSAATVADASEEE